MRRIAFLVTAFLLSIQANAQDAAQQVQLLAPQLVAFAGSGANFQSLANGLVAGTPITITGLTADGLQQTVTITPQGPMSAPQAAQTLESARQLLISRGIAQPTAQQIGVALMGGALPTALGTAQVTGTVSGTINTAAVQLQQQPAPIVPFGGSAANFQSLNAGLQGGGTVALNAPTGQAISFNVPGGPMSATEANQALQSASQLLFSQGITNPTPDQIRAALVGGTVVSGLGGNVQLRGVLQGRGTSPASPTFTTTNPTFTTTNPTLVTTNPTIPNSSTGASTPPNGSPSPAAQMQQQLRR